MLKIVAAVIGIAVAVAAGILGYAATRPDSFRVERALDIKAPPEKIYGILTDFRQSPQWSPYEKKDPGMKRSFGGASTGKGATYEWDGDSNVGAGRLEIADVGTGSGILAVCAAKYVANSRVTAIDISPAALAVANRNDERHGVAEPSGPRVDARPGNGR